MINKKTSFSLMSYIQVRGFCSLFFTASCSWGGHRVVGWWEVSLMCPVEAVSVSWFHKEGWRWSKQGCCWFLGSAVLSCHLGWSPSQAAQLLDSHYAHGNQGTQKGLMTFSEPFTHAPLTPWLGHKVSFSGNWHPMRGSLGAAHLTSALDIQPCCQVPAWPQGCISLSQKLPRGHLPHRRKQGFVLLHLARDARDAKRELHLGHLGFNTEMFLKQFIMSQQVTL